MKSWFRLSQLAFIVILFSVDLNSVEGIFGDEVERGDNFIDKLLKDMLEENGHEYDPYLLEESKVGFSKKITFVNVTGEAKLHNGYIIGLKSLHRPDHCAVEDKDGKLHVRADLGAGVLNFHYDGTVKFMNFGPTISVNGELAYLEIHMEFTVDSKTGRDGELEKFYIDDMKGMDIRITGLGPMNWALNYLISGITSLFKGYMKGMFENKIRKHLAERLPKYQFPVEGVYTTEEITTRTEVSEEITTQTEVSEEATTQTEVSEEATTLTEVSEEITTQTEVSEEVTTQTEVSEEVTTQTEVSEEVTSQTEVSEEVTSQTEVSEEVTSQTEVSEEVTSQTEEPEEITTEAEVSEETVPDTD